MVAMASNAEVKEVDEDTVAEAGHRGTDAVTATNPRPKPMKEYRDMPCLAHLDPATGKSTHTNRNCKWVNDLKSDPEAGYKRARKHRPRGKGGKGKNKDKEEDNSEAMDEDDASPDPKEGIAAKSNPFGKKSVGVYHTFLGTPTVRHSKLALRILNAIVPAVPQYVRWSETPCTFDGKDHPTVVPKECYALVVSPRIDGYDFSKCLMDGGAILNIMYLETLERMNLTKEQLKHSTTDPWCHLPTYDAVCSKDQIGRNVHAYVDDIAVMTRKGSDLISDLTETFENLRKYKMMLNPLKCVFGVPAVKLLGFIVSNRGIEMDKLLDISLEPEPETWVMHFDGSKQHQGSGAGVTDVYGSFYSC
ncbi:hypothetical protein QYE76_005216 [Lolium multiflorum]|uniref:Reverse transcriptase domain-containing protein n=1 Tax=Lolium multiflorum TaxID=4521 RepID=A0AAD8W369_LOLMU|nr:hypothetical protein QYE76_005216 [Lolium multiflorum]